MPLAWNEAPPVSIEAAEHCCFCVTTRTGRQPAPWLLQRQLQNRSDPGFLLRRCACKTRVDKYSLAMAPRKRSPGAIWFGCCQQVPLYSLPNSFRLSK